MPLLRQTVPLTVERGQSVVNFLNSADCPSINDYVPNCYPLGDATDFVRSPWVPVIIEGVRVPMLLDTGAEVTILSSDFLNRLCPGQEFPGRGRTVRSLGGITFPLKAQLLLRSKFAAGFYHTQCISAMVRQQHCWVMMRYLQPHW